MSKNNIVVLNYWPVSVFAGIFLFLSGFSAKAQIPRVTEYNTIAWFQLNTEFQLNKKWGIHLDLNSRRVDFVALNMQALFRTGVNYRISEKVLVRLGFAFAMNSPYGETPINVYGKSFNEKRLFQMVSIADKVGSLDLTHRFMLEQRWLDKFSKPELEDPDGYTYLNRIRYMFRMQLPLKRNKVQESYPYLAAYDELMIGFGNEVNANVFDQNRLVLLAGYRFNKIFRIEGGYMNQIFQLPRRVNDNNVFQHNNGIQVNLALTIPTNRK